MPMEVFQLNCAPLWTTIAVTASILLYLYSTWSFDFFKKRGIKGPKPWPLFGNILDLFTKPASTVDINNAKRFGKFYGLFNGRSPVFMVGDPDLVEAITIKEFSSFVNRTKFSAIQVKPLDKMLSVLTDDHWRHIRSSLLPTFTSGKLKEMFSTIKDCAKVLVDYLDKQDSKPINTKEVLSGYTMDVIAGTAFGLDVRTLENQDSLFLQYARTFSSFATQISLKRIIAILINSASQGLGRACRKLGICIIDPESATYMENVVKSAINDPDRAEGRKDFVQLCLNQIVDITKVDKESLRETDGNVWTSKGLTRDEVVSNAIIFLMAGYDTTSTFLNMFCYAMAVYPDIQQRLHKDIIENTPSGEINYEKLKDIYYLDWCVDEAFRMFPPVLRLDRVCNKTTTIGSASIPAGITVNILVYSIHHDPDYWPEPDVFRPERFSPEEKSKHHPCAYLPFGLGPRNCIGMRLALLEAKTAIIKILLKFEIVPSESTPKPPIKLGISFGFLTPEKPFTLCFKPRQESTTA